MLKILTFTGLLFISMLLGAQFIQTLKWPINQVLQQLKRPTAISIDTSIKKNRISEDAESFRVSDLVLGRYFE